MRPLAASYRYQESIQPEPDFQAHRGGYEPVQSAEMVFFPPLSSFSPSQRWRRSTNERERLSNSFAFEVSVDRIKYHWSSRINEAGITGKLKKRWVHRHQNQEWRIESRFKLGQLYLQEFP